MKKRTVCLMTSLCLAGAVMVSCSSTPPETSAESSVEGDVVVITAQVAETTETTIETTEAAETEPVETTEETFPEAPEDAVIPEGYHYIWSDEFNGDTLDSCWYRESHSPGWVNNELQRYSVDEEYCYVSDGDLIIQPTVEYDDDGEASYTSARICSVGGFKFQYGYIEARIRVPEGQGFLPAFWMLPSTGQYGSWPESGEIDIMEVVGFQPDATYGTLHYGDPHEMSQGSYEAGVNLYEDYHIYACEWEPESITFYLDGEPFYQTSDWFSSTPAGATREWPAPFDQNFYIIFNVAVGGDWPGDPDETTPFDERAQMRVDWVRVYQKDA